MAGNQNMNNGSKSREGRNSRPLGLSAGICVCTARRVGAQETRFPRGIPLFPTMTVMDGGDVAGKRWLYIVVHQNTHVHTTGRLFTTPPGTSRPGFRCLLSESKLEWRCRVWGYHRPDQRQTFDCRSDRWTERRCCDSLMNGCWQYEESSTHRQVVASFASELMVHFLGSVVRLP